MAFAGGPLNHFSLQALVRMAQVLREDAGSLGLVTAVSGIITKQGVSLWSSEPGATAFAHDDVSDATERETERVELIEGAQRRGDDRELHGALRERRSRSARCCSAISTTDGARSRSGTIRRSSRRDARGTVRARALHRAGRGRGARAGMSGFNLADLFEQAVDHFGPRECLVANGVRRTYAEMEARANRLAHHLARHGVRPGDHVGIYAQNCVEWVETLWAVFKLRAVWININYRYVEDELRYLVANADLQGAGVRAAATRRASPGCARRCRTSCTRSSSRTAATRRSRASRRSTSKRRWPRLAGSRLRAALGRRSLHPLHGRHDGAAEGCRVAARGRVLRARRRHRPDDAARRRSSPAT